MAVLYDCTEDILLTSERVSWLEVDDQQLSRPGFFLLWLLLHHKPFMKPLDKDNIEQELQVAGLLKIFAESKALDDNKKLNSQHVSNWPPRNWLKNNPYMSQRSLYNHHLKSSVLDMLGNNTIPYKNLDHCYVKFTHCFFSSYTIWTSPL